MPSRVPPFEGLAAPRSNRKERGEGGGKLEPAVGLNPLCGCAAPGSDPLCGGICGGVRKAAPRLGFLCRPLFTPCEFL